MPQRWPRVSLALNPGYCSLNKKLDDEGGKHESFCAKFVGVIDGGAAPGQAVVPDTVNACRHRRGIRTLEERPFQLGPLGKGRRDRSLEPDHGGEKKRGGGSRQG